MSKHRRGAARPRAPEARCPHCGRLSWTPPDPCRHCGADPFRRATGASNFADLTPVGAARMEGTFLATLLRLLLRKIRRRRAHEQPGA
jgi:hypothetical protein